MSYPQKKTPNWASFFKVWRFR